MATSDDAAHTGRSNSTNGSSTPFSHPGFKDSHHLLNDEARDFLLARSHYCRITDSLWQVARKNLTALGRTALAYQADVNSPEYCQNIASDCDIGPRTPSKEVIVHILRYYADAREDFLESSAGRCREKPTALTVIFDAMLRLRKTYTACIGLGVITRACLRQDWRDLLQSHLAADFLEYPAANDEIIESFYGTHPRGRFTALISLLQEGILSESSSETSTPELNHSEPLIAPQRQSGQETITSGKSKPSREYHPNNLGPLRKRHRLDCPDYSWIKRSRSPEVQNDLLDAANGAVPTGYPPQGTDAETTHSGDTPIPESCNTNVCKVRSHQNQSLCGGMVNPAANHDANALPINASTDSNPPTLKRPLGDPSFNSGMRETSAKELRDFGVKMDHTAESEPPSSHAGGAGMFHNAQLGEIEDLRAALHSANLQIAEKDATIDRLKGCDEDLTEFFERQEAVIRARESSLAVKDKALKAVKAKRNKLRRRLTAKLSAKESELVERNGRIEQLKRAEDYNMRRIETQDTLITTQTTALETLQVTNDDSIKESKQRLQEKDCCIRAKDKVIKDLENTIQQTKALVQDRNASIRACHDALEEKTAQAQKLERKNRRLKERLKKKKGKPGNEASLKSPKEQSEALRQDSC
ncbi:uncharacterized protein JN550_011367 [Neoarthrinium moseri]|uniref:uncharacterized protein n=1 Tax=Neoarthrinium moseri TaxID=1658444 RepID=UPI001FDBA08E|nr:uncharacterized protein JN550_011367 [Neoarthrinium moseri]KAI1860766.1 hypothetical protein JN550_011367 [Neoarthrinium moseri]